MGFHPVAVVGKIVHKQRIKNCTHGEKQFTEQTKTQNHKIENKTYKTRKQT